MPADNPALATIAALRYDDMGNTMLLPMIPAGKKVLDVGCSTGLRAKWLREHRNCWVAGIEIDPDMAALAAERCNSLQIADLDALPPLPHPDSFFDVLVFGDVLEHLKDPPGLVVQLMKYMRPDGIVVISIPNFVFLDIRLRILFGQFRYTKKGILDGTHLRFYTRRTLREMLEQCGLSVSKWDYTPPWFGVWRVFPGPVRRLMARIWPTLLAGEFVVTCVRAA